MRLAFLTHEPFYPPSGGGSAEAIYLVQELVERGHQVHLFCPTFPDPASIEKRFSPSSSESKPASGSAGPGPVVEQVSRLPSPAPPNGLGTRHVPLSGQAKGEFPGRLQCHLFTSWEMGRYAPFRNFKYLAYPVFLQRMVERAARQVRFDLVLAQHAISAVAAGRLKRTLGIPAVMNFLDYLTGFMETWPAYVAPRPFIRALERFELSMPNRYQADGVMTVSDTLADYFVQAGYPRERIRPIYYGYDARLFHPIERPAGESGGSSVVVMHGSFDHHHLGSIAATAVRYVAEKRPETRFRFVGRQTPALTKFCQRMRASVPRIQLECTGFVPYTEIARHLATATVGIVPYEESTGTHCAFVAKIVEYLAVGLPIVSTPLNSARRYFGNEPAARFSGFDGASFGREILTWLDQPPERRHSLGRAASLRVQSKLDWRAISRKAIDFVEKTRQQQARP